MVIETLFTIAKLRNQSRYLSTDEWIKKIWRVHIVEFYLAIKKNKIMSFARKWVQLGVIMLSERSQAQKDKYLKSPLICRS
jgi:hypothetical protein